MPRKGNSSQSKTLLMIIITKKCHKRHCKAMNTKIKIKMAMKAIELSVNNGVPSHITGKK
eukprot:15273662-Ditylum_brightwellii.AAC.1